MEGSLELSQHRKVEEDGVSEVKWVRKVLKVLPDFAVEDLRKTFKSFKWSGPD
jgi:hypothetical protein